MNQATNRKPTSSEINRILLEYHGPRITVGPGTNNIVLTDSFDRLRTVTWGGIYKLAIDGFTVTGRDIFQALLTPGQFECIRAVSEPDDRTASFLDRSCGCHRSPSIQKKPLSTPEIPDFSLIRLIRAAWVRTSLPIKHRNLRKGQSRFQLQLDPSP